MNFKSITDTLDGVSLSEQALKNNVTKSTMTYRVINAIKKFKRSKHLRSNKEVYNAIKNDKHYRDITKNKENWNKAFQYLSNRTPDNRLKPVSTIFKADNFMDAFDIAKKQAHTLNAYEGALLMYNTMVTKYNIN